MDILNHRGGWIEVIAGGNSQIEVGDISYEARCRVCYEPYLAKPTPEKKDATFPHQSDAIQ